METMPNPGARLTEAQVLEIWRLASEGVSTTDLMRRFGVGKNTVQCIVRGQSWTYLTGGKRAREPYTGSKGRGKLTAQMVIEARREVRNGAMFTEVADRFGVSPNAVRYAVRGVSWSEVDEIEPPFTDEIGSGRPGEGMRRQ